MRRRFPRWPGRGDPILMLHEGLGAVSMWRDFPDHLAVATGHAVVAWSRRGYGDSDPLPRPYAPDYMHAEAECLPALMDAIGVGRAHLFGHSDGASIALIAAAARPERVASLILEAPHVLVERVTVDSIAAVREAYGSTDLRMRLARHHRDADRVFNAWNEIWLDRRFRDWNLEGLLAGVAAPGAAAFKPR